MYYQILINRIKRIVWKSVRGIFIELHLGVSVNAEPSENSLHLLTERNLCFHNSLLNSYTRHRQVHQVQKKVVSKVNILEIINTVCSLAIGSLCKEVSC